MLVRLKGKEEGKITFPGGFREIGETLVQATQGEFLEETGMLVNELELFKTYTNDEQRLIRIVYKGKLKRLILLKIKKCLKLFSTKISKMLILIN